MTTPARDLLAAILRDPDLVSRLGDDEPMLFAGVNSGDLVRLTLAVEQRLGRPLSSGEVSNMRTLADVDRLLGGGSAPLEAADVAD